MAAGTPLPFLSIVVPTYNRRDLVQRSIDSARAWSGERADIEIVVVDDASTDGTADELRRVYVDPIQKRELKIIVAPHNLGAAGAKNLGAAEARGRWVMFLDSDDALIADSRAELLSTLSDAGGRSIVFFRCLDMADGHLIGAPSSKIIEVGARTYLTRWAWGECLPVVRRSAFLQHPYEARLRGHEGLAYARIMKHVAPALVSPLVVRLYDASGDDRLSRRSALIRRSALLSRGYAIVVREFAGELGFRATAALALRSIAYGFVGILMNLGRVFKASR